MSKEQIEAMAKGMCGNCMPSGNCATDDEPCNLECIYGYCAERLYQQKYRKHRCGECKKVSEKYPRYACTSCNHLFNNKEYKYCPNCGAKMKGESNGTDN